MSYPRIVLIGNGFDLAHGLKTSYGHFVDWYMCQCFNEFEKHKGYSDCLVDITSSGISTIFPKEPGTLQEMLALLRINNYQKLNYKSHYFERLIENFKSGDWIDIERDYFDNLIRIFEQPFGKKEQIEKLKKLNSHFDHIILKLSEYIEFINEQLQKCKRLAEYEHTNLYKALQLKDDSPITFVNFNYTDTLKHLDYANEQEIIHIHGQVSNKSRNPIIFGYGDITAPEYQSLEDTGENAYLEHIKIFQYFNTQNYSNLIAGLDNGPYKVSIVGHSCGLSDRILLSEIFEHKNCKEIEIFFHKRADGSNNYTEITKQISRHFKPQNKEMYKRRVLTQNHGNYIPQNIN
jgi:uncharacterized protein YdcH (DUF465 family)